MAEDTTEEKDQFVLAKEAETRILKLQADVHHLKQRIHLAESEERAEIEECDRKIKANEALIKKLSATVQDLQITKNKGLHGDEKLISKAFRKHSKDVGILANKSGKEAKEFLDEKVLFLIKRSNALTHELKVKDKKLAKLKRDIKEVAWNTYNEFECEHPESDTLRRVRELENSYQKVEKNLMECQIIQAKYRAIHELLSREILAFPSLLEELEERCEAQQADLERLVRSEERAQERREAARRELTEVEAAALRARQDKEKVVAEYSKALKPKAAVVMQKHSFELRDSDAAVNWRHLRAEQEEELKRFHEAFEKIKDAIGISDIHDAEERFLSQKATREELSKLVKTAEDKLLELKTEAQRLQTRNESLRGAELISPQTVLEKKLEDAKSRQEKQRKRKATAEAELERINKLHADIKSGMWQQLQLMEKYLNEVLELEEEEIVTTPDEEVETIVSKIEELLIRVFEKLEKQDLQELKNALKEEEFLPKMEATKLIPSAGAGRKLKTADEEESSDDEDFEKKRTNLKKEAFIYAEVKKKQQGRGRMMML